MLYLKYSSFLSCAVLLTTTAGVSTYEYPAETYPKISQHKEVATWEEAKQHCESRGATLASPISEELLQYMKAIIAVNNHTTPYFIGFKARDNAEFMSEEGILLEDVPEAIDMVERIDPRKGDCLSMDSHSIRVEPCWSRLPYMCYINGTSGGTTTTEMPTTTPEEETEMPSTTPEEETEMPSTTPEEETEMPTTTPEEETEMPTTTPEEETHEYYPGYTLYPTGCYKLHGGQLNWENAVSTCAAEGAHLVVVNDSDEAKVVAGIVRGYITRQRYSTWVGLTKDQASQDWGAITGERLDDVYHVWEGPHEDNSCGILWYYGKLDDIRCSTRLSFVCEK